MIDSTLVYELRAAAFAGDYHTLVLVPPKRPEGESYSTQTEESYPTSEPGDQMHQVMDPTPSEHYAILFGDEHQLTMLKEL